MTTNKKLAKCREQDTGKAYIDAFNRRTSDLQFLSCGICSKCSDCQSTFDAGELTLERLIQDGLTDEGGYSRSGCDCCGSSLYQMLYAGHAYVDLGGKQVLTHLDLCVDCMLYIANGQLPERWQA